MERSTFRYGFCAGLAVAAALGVYLLQLWAPENQVRLHTDHLLEALEAKDWEAVTEFLAPDYRDEWGHDRAEAIAQLRRILPYARNLRLIPREVITSAEGAAGRWRGKVRLEAEPNEVSVLLMERVNALDEPFLLEWRKASWKPWDWRLTWVTNAALQLPERGF